MRLTVTPLTPSPRNRFAVAHGLLCLSELSRNLTVQSPADNEGLLVDVQLVLLQGIPALLLGGGDA